MKSLDEIVSSNREGASRLPPAKVFANTVVTSHDPEPKPRASNEQLFGRPKQFGDATLPSWKAVPRE
jgi:hypothetical protein